MTEPEWVVISVGREGRRRRYHRTPLYALGPGQCNLARSATFAQVHWHGLPALKRPWSQLCRRCWDGSPELARALAARPAPTPEV